MADALENEVWKFWFFKFLLHHQVQFLPPIKTTTYIAWHVGVVDNNGIKQPQVAPTDLIIYDNTTILKTIDLGVSLMNK